MHYLVKDTEFEKILNFYNKLTVSTKMIYRDCVALQKLYAMYAEVAASGAYCPLIMVIGELCISDSKNGVIAVFGKNYLNRNKLTPIWNGS